MPFASPFSCVDLPFLSDISLTLGMQKSTLQTTEQSERSINAQVAERVNALLVDITEQLFSYVAQVHFP